MSLPRTSKDLISCPSFFFLALPQNLHKKINAFDFNNVKQFLPKNSFPNNPPKKILQKKSSKKLPLKNPPKIPPKNPEKIQNKFS